MVTEHSVFLLLYKQVHRFLQAHKLHGPFPSALLRLLDPSQEREALTPPSEGNTEFLNIQPHCGLTVPNTGNRASLAGFMDFGLPLGLTFWNVREAVSCATLCSDASP